MKTSKRGSWCEIVVPSQREGITVEQLLNGKLALPKKIIHRFRMGKGVKVNGEVVSWHTKIYSNDLVAIEFFYEEIHHIIPEYNQLEIVYEDDHILIVNKPKGMDTHPNEAGQRGTLANLVAGYFEQTGIRGKPRHIHRLDKDTTGGVIFAKHASAGAIMDKLLAEGKIKRMYIALVHGVMKKDKGIINEPIGKDRHHSTRRRVSPNGQKAITHFQVVERHKDTTLVALQLETGRTHQIRVHMSHIGHSLVGDTLYGGKKQGGHHTQALHAYKIKMQHPITQEIIQVDIPNWERGDTNETKRHSNRLPNH